MARDRMTRQREYELMELEASLHQPAHRISRQESQLDWTSSAWDSPESRLGRNTMAPPDEVVERRRMRRRRVTMVNAGGTNTRNILRENVIMLLLLVASIYGLYRLIIYLLNQS